MGSIIRREIKDNLGDQLRGVRHLVRALGSDTAKSPAAKPPLPAMPPELNSLFGKTFRTMDRVMTTLESMVMPLFSPDQAGREFKSFDFYFGAAKGIEHSVVEVMTADLYEALKRVSTQIEPNPLILKGRTMLASKDLIANARSERWNVYQIQWGCAALFHALTRHQPLICDVDEREKAAWKLYGAVSLLFGLAVSDRLVGKSIGLYIHEAIMICGSHRDIFLAASKEGANPDVLASACSSLLRQLHQGR